MSFGEHEIRVRLPKLIIELERPWSENEITSPLYISFLAKLKGMLPNLEGMRLASSMGSTVQSSTSQNQDPYRLGPVIGHGKSGIVYRASHRQTGHAVAIKRYNQSSSGSAEACNELANLLKLKHVSTLIISHAFFL